MRRDRLNDIQGSLRRRGRVRRSREAIRPGGRERRLLCEALEDRRLLSLTFAHPQTEQSPDTLHYDFVVQSCAATAGESAAAVEKAFLAATPISGDFPRGAAPPSFGPAPSVAGADALIPAVPGDAGTLPAALDPMAASNGYGSAWSQNLSSQFLARFALDAPASLSNLGYQSAFFPAGDFDNSGSFITAYAINGDTNTLVRMNMTNGTVTNVGASTPYGGESWSGMAMDPTSGVMYACSTSITTASLYTLNLSTGAATRIAAISNCPGIIALAVDGTGQMYGEDIVNDTLVRITKATGAGTVVGSLGFDANFSQGMDFDPASSQLYLAAFNNATTQGELRIANRTTGATTLVGALGSTSPGGVNEVHWLGIAAGGGGNNDNFVNRRNLGSGSSATDTGTNVGYTGETGEPAQSGTINSAWWSWTAPSTGVLTVDTFGSGFDTFLTLATGSAVNALTVRAQNDDTGGLQSQVTYSVTSGTQYQIAVDGFSSNTGAITLHVSFLSSNNDNFVNRRNLGSGNSATDTGTNVGYTGETGEPAQSGAINSAWWSWTAPSAGTLTVDTFGSGFDTFLTLATGSAVNALTVLAQNDDTGGLQSQITYSVTSGTQYRIAVDGFSSNTGSITLNLSFTPGGAQPNLTPYQPAGWSDKIVVSNRTGTNTDDSPLSTTDTLYVDWAVINNGAAATAARFYTELYVDDSLRASWYVDPPLNTNWYVAPTDYNIGSLSAGAHTVKIITDSTGAISESNEADNQYVKTINVSGQNAPNLTPYQPAGWSDKIVVSNQTGTNTDDGPLSTTDTLYVDWSVINNGTVGTAATFYTELYVDELLRATWSIAPPLDPNWYVYVQDYDIGSLTAGAHTVKILTDSTGAISESNEADNQYVKTINVGSPPSAEIRGAKWNDLDGDGQWDQPGEPGLQGWTIYVDENRNGQWDGALVESFFDVTAPDGSYAITGLAAGEYWVGEVLQSGWEQTYPGGATPPGDFRLLAGTGMGGANDFSLVELQTAPVAEVLIGPASYNPGLDVDPTSGLLYGASSSLRIVDSSNGSYTTVGSINSATQTAILMRSIAFSPSGTLYGVSTDGQKLYTINKSTAFATEIGTIPGFAWGIDFAPDGTLYTAEFDLCVLDPNTGNVLSTIGSLSNSVVDIDYAPDGFIYGVDYASYKLYRIDPANAGMSLVGTYSSELWGVASEAVGGGGGGAPAQGLVSVVDVAAAVAEEQALKASLPPPAQIDVMVVDGPPTPPVGVTRAEVTAFPRSAVTLSEVPTSRWTFGCSATSAGMIFGYYDRNGYPNIYTGPANGGVAPLTELGQGAPGDAGYPFAGACSIIATDNGFDGRATNGHAEDYWTGYLNPGPDPWEGNWAEHTWGACTADYMGTNQWKWDFDFTGGKDSNVDGATTFFWNTDGSRLYDFIPDASYGLPRTELCHGMRLFAESRGYTVLENYTQMTDNYHSGGFSFANYTAEIDAGYPAMIQVEGHSMVGVGYDAPTQTVYLHDTWDNVVHSMTWGGSYSGMGMIAVTVIHLAPQGNPPGMHVVSLASGEVRTGVHFGNQNVSGSIEGAKWNDLDGDGQWDQPGEPGLEGWTIYVDENRNGQWDGALVESFFDVTGPDGSYAIPDLPAGTYWIGEVQQAGWQQTYPGGGAPGAPIVYRGPGPDSPERWTRQLATAGQHAQTPLTVSQVVAAPGSEAYAYDDGVSESTIGLTNGGDIMWGNYFTALPGHETITSIALTWSQAWQPPDGTPCTVFVYDDPDDDGNPSNATLLTSAGTVVANGGTDVFTTVPITPTTVSGGFFVSALITHAAGLYPASIDATTSAGGSWVTANTTPGAFDVNTLTNNDVPPARIDDIGFPGNFMVRADGEAGGPPPGFHEVVLGPGQVVIGIHFGNEPEIDFGDAPDPTYPTLLASNGARHLAIGPLLGTNRDTEPDGQPTAAADGDDLAGTPDDEDGVVFTSALVGGQTAFVDVTASAPALLSAWIDFNSDGDWADAGEQVFADAPLAAGLNALSFPVPATPPNVTYARFRLSTAAGLSFSGLAPDGEVEDYALGKITGSKWNDLDADRQWDQPGEPGLAGWTIYVDWNLSGQYDAGEPSAVTGPDGSYAIAGLPPGTYAVGEVAQAGWQQTYPNPVGPAPPAANEGGVLVAPVEPGGTPAGYHTIPASEIPKADRPFGATLPDAFQVPDEARAELAALLQGSPPPAGLAPYGATPDDTTEYMMGDVWVTVVLLESNGTIDAQTENWTTTEISQVKGEIQEGLQWWKDTLLAAPSVTPLDDLDFHVDFTYADSPVATGYEPIGRPQSDEGLWIDSFLNQVGYNSGSSYFADVTRWDHDRRIANNSHWSYTVFVVDSSADADGMFSDGYFAYAYLGGPFTVLTYDNDGWGIGRMGQVFAHESGHIFYALDEYPGAGRYTDRSGYYNTQNLNASDGHPDPNSRVASIMAEANLQDVAYANHTSSPSSLQMLGWKDSDGDGIFDALDVPLTLTGTGGYNGAAHQYEFSGTSAVQTLTNLNPWGLSNDITTNTVDRIQYRLDGGAWQDGNTYGTYTPSVSQNVPVLGGGAHTIDFRTIFAETGLTSALFSDTFTAVDLPGTHTVQLGPGETAPGVDFGNWHQTDYGDAPDTYATTLAADGARHLLTANGPRLGALVDAETDGQPSPTATGDDTGGSDDEDGVVFATALKCGRTARVQVDMTASPAAGLLSAWIDLNRDGDFVDAGEQVLANVSVAAGSVHTLSFPVPGTAEVGASFARFRVSSTTGLSYSGPASDGEVEDYAVTISSDVPDGGRYVFYNRSKFDGNNPAANAADDAAIAPGKQALLPGAKGTFANYTSYSRGLNGIMVDVLGLPVSTLDATDFEFKYGNDNNPAGWSTAAAPTTVAVRAGAGVGGSDRVTLIWADNAIPNGKWLQVRVKANGHTGLAAADVFYFGCAIGETGDSTLDAKVNSSDVTRIRNNYTAFGSAPIESFFDINRDGKVNSGDVTVCRNYFSAFTPMKLITVPAGSPLAGAPTPLVSGSAARATAPDSPYDTVFASNGVLGSPCDWLLDLAWLDQVQPSKPKADSSAPAAAQAAVDWALMS